MSLINEALKRADATDQTPPAKRSTHSVEHLYDDQVPAPDAASTEKISRLLRKNQTSLRGAVALGVCVITGVAMIMHLTLPTDQRGPVEAQAGLQRAQSSRGTTISFETRTHQPAETKTAPDKTSEKSTISALQQALAGIVSQNADKTPKTTPLPKPAEAVPSVCDKQDAEQFALSGILASGGRGHAIVNGHMVTVGDNIDGARVITIGKHHVVLEKGGKQFVLRM